MEKFGPWQRSSYDRKMNVVNRSTNPENLVKIGPVLIEIMWLECRPLKIN